MEQNQEKNEYQELIRVIGQRKYPISCTGMKGSAASFALAHIYTRLKIPLFIVAPSSEQAERIYNEISFYLGNCRDKLFLFPSYHMSPFKLLSYHNEISGSRMAVLFRLIENKKPPIVVTDMEALMQKIVPKSAIIDYAELLMEGEDIDRDELISKLISGGYTRTSIVEEPGDFCVRGGIMDIFSPLYDDPVRIEFFGDAAESLRFFSASTQRTRASVKEAVIIPARECIMAPEMTNDVISRIRKRAVSLDLAVSDVREIIRQIKTEQTFEGFDTLLPLIYKDTETLFDYMPGNTLPVLTDPAKLDRIGDELIERAEDDYEDARSQSKLCVKPASIYIQWPKFYEIFCKCSFLAFRMIPISFDGRDDMAKKHRFQFKMEDNTDAGLLQQNRQAGENFLLPLCNWIREKKDFGYGIVIICASKIQAGRLKSLLEPYGILPVLKDGKDESGKFPGNQEDLSGKVTICIGSVNKGFVWPAAFLALISEQEIFGKRHASKARKRKQVKTGFVEFADLKKGDPVVHSEHGIGCYDGLVKLTIDKTACDFLLIRYKDDDKLYLPVDRMSLIEKYMGAGDGKPHLDKMGGSSWNRVKNRVKKSVQKIAEELLKLYAKRKVEKGHAFSVPDDFLSDFEAAFPYDETPDQKKAIDDVLADMASPVSMDRLVCGDVGYGKTEVALRASFAAVFGGKQVSILVPTTVLAEQHFSTFSDRFSAWPIRLACMTRFRSKKEQKEIIEGLKKGEIDIVIGTHRLLQKDVAFNDIGLMILDEEQRFGVKHKEKLKKIRSNVDVLALTATPIPRTLHLSLMGVRDISLIATPPQDRHSIITYICKLDDAVITDAVRKELGRGGQIFFVHNNISTIKRMARHIQTLVPEVRLDVIHGRMDEENLERIMLDFMNNELDMLVATSIIESGLDITLANTILVNRADLFGLSQIYQLRGRVGRSGRQAYAYLFIPDESLLKKDAKKRLKVLMEHSDLGSGFKIAMNDLKIRGGGSILGASQSGHITAVGYDMFLKLMEESVSTLKGEPVTEALEPEININRSAFLSEKYIPGIDQRMAAYRRLSKMGDLKQISDFKNEMTDRFGPMPEEAGNLLLKIMFRVLAIKAGIARLDLVKNCLSLRFSPAHLKNHHKIVNMVAEKKYNLQLIPDHVLKARFSGQSMGAVMGKTKNILKEIIQHVNE